KTQNPDTSIILSLQAKLLADSLSYKDGQYLSRRLLAQTYSGTANFRLALLYANEAKSFLGEASNSQENVKLLSVFGLIYNELGEFTKGANYYFESLKICEKMLDSTCMSESYNNIGNMFYDRGDMIKSSRYYNKSISFSTKLNDQAGIARGLNNLATIHAENGDYDVAKELLSKALLINQKTGVRIWEGINYLNFAEIYRLQKIYDTSLVYYYKASLVFKDLGHPRLMVNCKIGLSNYYEETNDIEKSVAYASQALSIAKDRKLFVVENLATKRLYELYTLIGPKEKAYRYGMKYYRLKDSLEIEQNASKLSNLMLLYEFDKKNQEQQIIQQEKETRYVLIFVSLFFFAVLIVIIILARHKLKIRNNLMIKRQLEDEIEIKDKELVLNVMSLLKKNEVLANVVDNLMHVHDEAVKDETKTAIIKIAKDIQKTSEDEIWEEFEVRFKQAHGDYYDRLNSRFPNLSPNELKLSAFLKLNMSTKDIAELTGKSVSSLEIARTRLRKKMGITNTKTNLISFISQI
ncbi:MAG: tetratricopeptide repeat protein, partial [Bacteroidales bacterium]|nr:tetratricopeptide repeat protein [Bacteroidales bacterium]